MNKSAIYKIEHIVQIVNDYQNSLLAIEAKKVNKLHCDLLAGKIDNEFDCSEYMKAAADVALARIEGYLE